MILTRLRQYGSSIQGHVFANVFATHFRALLREGEQRDGIGWWHPWEGWFGLWEEMDHWRCSVACHSREDVGGVASLGLFPILLLRSHPSRLFSLIESILLDWSQVYSVLSVRGGVGDIATSMALRRSKIETRTKASSLYRWWINKRDVRKYVCMHVWMLGDWRVKAKPRNSFVMIYFNDGTQIKYEGMKKYSHSWSHNVTY